MGIISKNIENLKPDKEYIVTVRAKNNDINVLSDYADSIRFRTPTDSTVPNAPTSLELAASFLNVLFKYTDSTDNDIARYEYELYKQNQIQTVNAVYQVISGQTPHRTGFVQTNIFTVSVDDNSSTTSTSSTTNPVKYYGRVRSIDTSGNISSWTNIVASGDTPLIDEEYIGSLTAAKITAGEIGAHTITLSGGTGPGNYSIIQSSTYNPNDATPSGWYIRGDGHLNFGGPQGITYTGSSVVIGSAVNVQAQLNANSITVGSDPYLRIDDDLQSGTKAGMELGDPTYNYWYTDGTFRVGNSSNYAHWNGTSLIVQGTIQAGSVGGVTISSTKLYIGTGTFGNSNTFFYVDNIGKFSLKDKLVWDGTTLTINGGGTFSGALSAATGTFTGALSGGTISIGSGNNIFKADSNGIYLGDATFASAKFSVSVAGALKATAGSVAGWTIGDANAPTGSLYSNSLYAGSGSTLALLSPSGFGWFSAGIITPSVSGYLSGVTTNGGALTSMFLRNIQYGGTKPLSGDPNPPKTGDIYFS